MARRIQPIRLLKAAGAAACVLASCAQPLEIAIDLGALARASVLFAGIIEGAKSAFAANPASDGQGVGSGLIGNAIGAMQSPSNQTFVGGLNTSVGSSQMSSAQAPYNDYLDPSTNAAIPNWAAAQNAVLTDPSCNNTGWSSVVAYMTSTMLPAATTAQTTCSTVATALMQSLGTAGGAAHLPAGTYGAVSEISGLSSSMVNLATEIIKVSGLPPSCNLVSPSVAATITASITTAANNLGSACAALPVTINASNAPTLISGVQAMSSSVLTTEQDATLNQALSEWKYGQSYAASTNNGQISIGSIMGTPASNATITGGLSSIASIGASPITAYLNNPANAPLLSGFEKFVKGTATQISGAFSNCVAAQTKYATTPGSATATSSTTVSTSTAANPNACFDPTHAASTVVMDPSAAWIYGNTAGNCTQAAGAVPLYTYVNNTYTTAESFTFQIDGSYSGATLDGTAITNGQTLSMAPGPHLLVINATGEVAAAGINGTSVVFDTASGWGIQLAAAATNGALVPGSSSTVSYPTPSAQQNTVLCNAAIQCLGTQCHSVMANQDQTFVQAMAGMSALQQMQTNAQCATRTSVAAGDCQPVLFQGTAYSCRTFPGGGWLTNDCCNNPVKTPLLSTMLKIATAAYSAAEISGVSSTIMTNADKWVGSDYKAVSGFITHSAAYQGITSAAHEVYSTVTAPFKSIAASWSNTFGGGGPSTVTQVGSLIGTAQTSNGQPQKSSTGATVAGTFNIVGSLSNFLSGASIQPIADKLIENLMGKAAASVEQFLFGSASASAASTAGSSYTGAVATSGSSAGASGSAASSGAGTAMGVLGYIALAYMIYEIVTLIGHLITSCENSEFQFKQYRDLKECFWVGSYCASSFLGMCLETQYVGCCYPSPLIRIIAQQIKLNQSWVTNDGTAKSPNCSGLTPDQLAKVDWSTISLQEWINLLVQGGMSPTNNTQGQNTYNAQNSSHISGMPSAYSNAQQGEAPVLTGQ